MFVRCFCELNVCLDEYELFARPRVAGHYTMFVTDFDTLAGSVFGSLKSTWFWDL